MRQKTPNNLLHKVGVTKVVAGQGLMRMNSKYGESTTSREMLPPCTPMSARPGRSASQTRAARGSQTPRTGQQRLTRLPCRVRNLGWTVSAPGGQDRYAMHVLLFNIKLKVCLSKSLSMGFSDLSFQMHLSTSSWEGWGRLSPASQGPAHPLPPSGSVMGTKPC